MGMPVGMSKCETKTSSCMVGLSSCSEVTPVRGNPNPRSFRILRIARINRNVVAEVLYPGCTNFEGKKILVFEKVTKRAVEEAGSLDPHFCEGDHLSPVARFRPDTRGWKLARDFARML